MQRSEAYAHKPNPTILTSTATPDDVSALIIATAHGDNDLQPHPHDAVRRLRFTVREDARVYEITGPADWAALSRRYPATDPGGHVRPVAPDGTLGPGEPEEVVPDWPAVARDWDGVHVSLGAMLTATDVWVTDPVGSSRFWGWDAEGTYWLRWCFDGYAPVPDLPFEAIPPNPLLDDAGAAYRNPVLASLLIEELLIEELLMAGHGPEAIALRSSRAIGMNWWSPSGPP